MYEIHGDESAPEPLFRLGGYYGNREYKYPLNQMKLGQWIFIPEEDAKTASVRAYIATKNSQNIRFTVKKSEGGCIVTRLY